MIAALGTLAFLATLWLLVVVGAAVLEESGAKIAAALKGKRDTPSIGVAAWRRDAASTGAHAEWRVKCLGITQQLVNPHPSRQSRVSERYPIRPRTLTGSATGFSPKTRTMPLSALSRPRMCLINVVRFPGPFSPTRPKTWPRTIFKVAWSRASLPSNRRVKSVISITFSLAAGRHLLVGFCLHGFMALF